MLCSDVDLHMHKDMYSSKKSVVFYQGKAEKGVLRYSNSSLRKQKDEINRGK